MHGAELGLLGVEIGRSKVRLALLDPSAAHLHEAVERPIAKAGGPRDPIEQEYSTRAAIEAGLNRLDIVDPTEVAVGATIGFPNCGVGSGPAMRAWLESLSTDLDEPVVYTGTEGISYVPLSCIDFVRRVFDPTGLLLERVELAPVAAARVIGGVRTGAITLGSGVAWSARLLDGQVLEAFEREESGFDDALHLVTNGVGSPLSDLNGFELDETLQSNPALSPATLAPAIGVALALLEPNPDNLLDGQSVGAGDVDPVPVSHRGHTVPPIAEPTGLVGDRSPVTASGPAIRGRANAGAGGVEALPDHRERPAIDHRLGAGAPLGPDELGYLPAAAPPGADQHPPTGELPARREARAAAPRRIEDFAHPDGSLPERRSFLGSDFVLGVLLMLAIALTVALVAL